MEWPLIVWETEKSSDEGLGPLLQVDEGGFRGIVQEREGVLANAVFGHLRCKGSLDLHLDLRARGSRTDRRRPSRAPPA